MTMSSEESARADANAREARISRRNEIIFTAVMIVILALIAFVILAVMNSAMNAPPSLEGP
jgi:uncharacterized integral membrane protein